MLKPVRDITEEEVRAEYERTACVNQDMTWEEVKESSYMFILLRNQAANTKTGEPVEEETPPAPAMPMLGFGRCYLNEYDTRKVYSALLAAKNAIAFNCLSESTRQDALENISRAAQLISRKTKTKEESRHEKH